LEVDPLIQFSKFLRFAILGAIGTGVHFVILWAMISSGLDVLSSSSVGGIGGALVNYRLNYRFTFNSDLAHSRTMVKFFTVALFGLILNLLIMAELTYLDYFIAQLITVFFVLLWNYLANLFWTFRVQGDDHG
jgi:putative flippase GtrA